MVQLLLCGGKQLKTLFPSTNQKARNTIQLLPMKIEHLIEDIKNDITELRNTLEVQLRRENPGLNFMLCLPGIEDLTTIKSMTLSFKEGVNTFLLSVYIHTHNDNRVFENASQILIDNQPMLYGDRHPFQNRFVDLLRDIIKRKKHSIRIANKNGKIINDLHHYVNTA